MSVTSSDDWRSVKRPVFANRFSGLVHGQKAFLLSNAEDKPPWFLCILLAMQHVFSTIAAMKLFVDFSNEYYFCSPTKSATLLLSSTTIMIFGIVTLAQALIGARMPQALSVSNTQAYYTLVFLSDELRSEEKLTTSCHNILHNSALGGYALDRFNRRMLLYQGVVVIEGIFQVLVGFFGTMGFVGKLTSPTVMAALQLVHSVSVIGWYVTLIRVDYNLVFCSIFFLALFSVILGTLKVQVPVLNENTWVRMKRVQLFRLYAYFLALLPCIPIYFFGGFNTLPDTVTSEGVMVGTEKLGIDQPVPYFRIPMPGQFGAPAMIPLWSALPVVLLSWQLSLECLTSYIYLASTVGMPNPPPDALNRAVVINGLGYILSGLCGGYGGPCPHKTITGYIFMTGHGSRRVTYCLALILIIIGVYPRLTSFLLGLPLSLLLGGEFFVWAVVLGQGMFFYHFTDMSSIRSRQILGVIVIVSLTLPKILDKAGGLPKVGTYVVDFTLEYMLTHPLHLSLYLAIILDHVIPGTNEEKGMIPWRRKIIAGDSMEEILIHNPYALPVGMHFILRHFAWTSHFPMCPVYNAETACYDTLRLLCTALADCTCHQPKMPARNYYLDEEQGHSVYY